jgi:hypothetical protein
MGKGYIARGHRPTATASGRSYESIDPKIDS